eukprot:TRINITY_DN4223_c0_g1_i2.p1 TRINITY_DN4223_c0_g1~~TRINITY_DN4223_c0_g1_i2.p1  ORF type:complete len:128 (-),score=15.80 TRINITY_DN4223_c0_g1_i2:32-379(-)
MRAASFLQKAVEKKAAIAGMEIPDEDAEPSKDIVEEKPASAPASPSVAVNTEKRIYSYEYLSKIPLPEDFVGDVTKKEDHLLPEDFELVFQMAKDKFYLLPKWKQTEIKKKLKLY